MSLTKDLGKDLAHQSKTKRYALLRNIILVGAFAYFFATMTLSDDYIYYYNPILDIKENLEEFQYYFMGVFILIFFNYIYFFYDGKFKKPLDFVFSFFGFAGVGRFKELEKNLIYQQPIKTDGLLRRKSRLVFFSKKRGTSISKLFDYEEGNPTTARIVKYFRSNEHYIDLFRIIEGYLNNDQFDALYEINGKNAKNVKDYRAFKDGLVWFSPELIKLELNKMSKDFDRYLQASIYRPTSTAKNLKNMSKKEHNKLVDVFSLVTFHKLIANFTNIPTGLIESKLDDYDFRRIVNYYTAEGFTIELSNDNNGTNKGFSDDTFSSVFLTLYHKYMHGSSELEPLSIIGKFDALADFSEEQDVPELDIDFSVNPDLIPPEDSSLINEDR